MLPAIHVPTLVIQRLDDRITPPYQGRYLASHIAGARYFEQAGDHSLRFSGSGDSDGLFDELEDFLAGAPARRSLDRVLATILVARAAAATTPREAAFREQACVSGPDGYGTAARYQVRSHRGRVIRLDEGSVLATFEAPGQAIRCAAALRDHAADIGIQTMAGIHTGELDLVGDDIAGASVELTRHLLMLARPAEILVSRTVKDLVVGSGLSFADRGSHQLGGILETWQLFAVTEPGR